MKKDKIQSMYKSCSAELTSRTNDIFHFLLGEGNYDAEIMVVGYMPSAKEEEYNQNILEDDRDRLMGILDPLGLSVDDVYMTYMVKYRPYRFNSKGRIVSRSPEQEELEFFMPYLEKEISLINPKVIITLGDETLGWVSGHKDLKVNPDEDQLIVTGILGKSYKLYPIYHPSSGKFSSSLERFNREDKERVHRILFDDDGLGFEMPGREVVKSTEAVGNVSNGNVSMKNDLISSDVTGNGGSAITGDGTNSLGESGINDKGSDVAVNTENEVMLKERVFEKIKLPVPKTEASSVNVEGGRDYITIVYGGEGYLDDPVLVALERISSVLSELGLGMRRIDLYKGNISMEKALTYINDSKGVIIGVTVEWFGIGHRLQKFLDDCFYSGSEAYFKDKPLFGVVFTRHSFERDGYDYLRKAWEVLGGREGSSLYTNIDLASKLETNFEWLFGIDKKAESYYRVLRQDKGVLPVSKGTEKVAIEVPVIGGQVTNPAIKAYGNDKSNTVKKPTLSDSMIEDYDGFVEKQQEDIKELSSFFKKKLSNKVKEEDNLVPSILKRAYVNKEELQANIQLLFDDALKENTVIELNDSHIRTYYGQIAKVDVSVSGKKATLMKILNGKLTMQRAFMTGEVKAKGDFTLLYKFEELFEF